MVVWVGALVRAACEWRWGRAACEWYEHEGCPWLESGNR